MNRKDFTPLVAPSVRDDSQHPLVSICVPTRNEEKNIARAVRSICEQDYANLEIIVLDDQSDDRTPDILSSLGEEYPEILSVIKGNPKPDSWLGKSWACHQLAHEANGDILIFMDADVWLAPSAVNRAVRSLYQFEIDFLTVWPVQILGTFWEKVVIPVIYYGLLTLLPARYVYRNPRWLPDKFRSGFAAACGQFMAFRRSAYEEIGGHQAVKNDIVEDVALAKRIKSAGFTMRMFHGESAAWCRMYRSGRDIWHGFRKNFLALYNDSTALFLLMAAINFIVYVLPVIVLLTSLWSLNIRYILFPILPLALISAQRLILARWFHWRISMSFLHFLGVLWFHLLGVQVLWDHFWGKRASWKNRPTGL